MRVLMLTINAGRGGVVNAVWGLARGLQEQFGDEVAVACDAGSELDRLKELGIRHFPVGFDVGKKGSWRTVLELRRVLREFEPEVVHSHSRWPTMLCMLAGRRPEVSTLHADRVTAHGSVLDAGVIRRVISGWGERVTVLDEEIRRRVAAEFGLGLERLVVVPNGVDERGFEPADEASRREARRELGIAEDARVVLFVGSLVKLKRAEWAIEAVAACRDAGLRDVVVVIVGDGAERGACERRAKELGLEVGLGASGEAAGNCRFLGWLPTAHAAYRAADLLVLPSEMEGFGLVCVEAMLMGVPVVRTRCGGAAAQIIEGRTGWSVGVADQRGFSERVVEAIGNLGKLREMGREARAHALANFTQRRHVEGMRAVYDSVLRSGSQRGSRKGASSGMPAREAQR